MNQLLDNAHVLKPYLRNLSFHTPVRINQIWERNGAFFQTNQTAGTAGQLNSFKFQIYCKILSDQMSLPNQDQHFPPSN